MASRTPTKTLIVVVAVLTIGVALAVRTFTGPYADLRRCATKTVGVDRLQAWAVSVLDNPPTTSQSGPEGLMTWDTLPEDIRQLQPRGGLGFVTYVKANPETGSQEHILFACGGGFHHYGLRVGRRGFEPKPDSQFRFERLGDGVWGMDE